MSATADRGLAAVTARRPETGAPRRLLPMGWLLSLLFLATFAWWALGLQGFIAAIFSVPLIYVILLRRWTKVPSGFWAWSLFLLWVPVTMLQIESPTTLLVAGWRLSVYVAATAIFLFIYNAPREELPTERLVKTMAGFWVFTVVGGVLGMVLPVLQFTSPTEAVLKQIVAADPLLRLMVHPTTALARSFVAIPLHRPNAPFPDPNQWGGNYALTLPFALASLAVIRNRVWRLVMWATLIVSLAPLVFSLDRGAWLASMVGVSYAAVRMARSRNAKALTALMLSASIVGALLFASPLGDFILVRLNNGVGDAKRLILYTSSIELAKRSPVLGWGSPVALDFIVPGAPPNPPIGTHGQLWLVMVSNGVLPGLLLFLGWWVWALWRTGRRGGSGRTARGPPADGNARFWCHVVILVALVEMPYYELIPWGLPIAMVAAAIAFREQMASGGRLPEAGVATRADPVRAGAAS